MGGHIHAHDNIDTVEHNPSRPIEIYIQAVIAAFKALENLSESISETAIGDHHLCHLNPSYHTICTSILAQETESNLNKIKSTLIGSASSEYITVKSETGLLAWKENGRTQKKPVTDEFREGKFTWCKKLNGDSCHCCGHDGHISYFCTCDMPSAIKDLVLQGAKDHAHEKAQYAYASLYADFEEQDLETDDNNGVQVIQANISRVLQI
ncbi:hypothetical protein C0992_005099 [Termitomyces sp. T32_za158]|nr:hypothetical protein C0992_005099 [Termitomyces sp. T32_za158]